MGARGGPDVVNDGLVVCLDAGNKKSFRGEPTTNVITNTNLDTGWSKHYQSEIIFNEISPPEGINSPVVGFNQYNTSTGYWYSYGNYAPQVPNTIYTVSIYVMTSDSNFRIQAYTANNSEVGRISTEFIHVPNDGEWHRVIWNSFLNPANSESDSLSFRFYFNSSISNDPNSRTWFCAPQMEAKPYATPFVDGSRGATVATGGGLADLVAGNHGELIGDIKGLSQSLQFEGGNKYITLGTKNFITADYTFSIWLEMLDTSEQYLMSIGYSDPYSAVFYIDGGQLGLLYRDNSVNRIYYGLCSVPLNTLVNITLSREDGLNKVYLNAVEEASVADSLNLQSCIYDIGWATTRNKSGAHFKGNMYSVQMYDRALTAEEVKQNYNATKGRFGL